MPDPSQSSRLRFWAMAVVSEQLAPALALGNCRVMAGTSSWADRSLVNQGNFYPSRSFSAAERLAFYATRFSIAEVATTYRFPPTAEVTRRWAGATPAEFKFDVRLWSLLSGAPTWHESLWPDLQPYAKPSSREGAKLYRQHLPPDVVDECWDRFRHALQPLADRDRLGVVVARFPRWFRPNKAAWEELANLAAQLQGFRVAVELENHRWFEGHCCEQTLAFLEQLGLCFGCVDGAGEPVIAATTDVAFVRFPGRHNIVGTQDDAPWWAYRYSHEELGVWVPRLRELASSTSELHVVMDNCWKSDAVDNALMLVDLLASGED